MRNKADQFAETILAGFNLISQAISIYDSDLRLMIANRRYQTMFDLPGHLSRSGASFADTIEHLARQGEYGEIDNIADFVRSRVDQALTFKPHYFERQRANGSTISIEGSPLPQGGWITVYADISESKRQEDMLEAISETLSGEILRRQTAPRGALETSNRVQFGGWSFDPDQHLVISDQGRTQKLSYREAQMLQVFFSAPNRLITRDYILDHIGDDAGEHFDRSIDVRISRLRSKLGDNPVSPKIIKTVYGAGYIFIAEIQR